MKIRSSKSLRMIPFEPMLLGKAREPFHNTRWTYELKWDGWRAIVQVLSGGVRIWTRAGRDITARFPDLSNVHRHVCESAVLDCELVALDENGYPQFERLRRRGQLHTLVAFDVLKAGRRNLIEHYSHVLTGAQREAARTLDGIFGT